MSAAGHLIASHVIAVIPSIITVIDVRLSLDISIIRTTMEKEVVMPKFLITLPKMPPDKLAAS